MVIVPVAATKGDNSDKKQPELEQPHLVLTFFSVVLVLLGLGLIAASL